MKKRNMLRLVLVCVPALLAGVASAQVFECIGAKGVKEYAHFCPPGTVRQRQIFKESDRGGDTGAENARGASGDAPKPIEVQEVEFRKRLLERQEAEAKAGQEKTQAEDAARNCSSARGQLKALEEGQRMTRIDPDTGERVNYGDEERAEDAERQRKAVAEWCK
jgi:hypothetical protein